MSAKAGTRVVFALLALTASGAWAEKNMFIVAHQDDDLYFMNPDILNAIKTGNSVEVVFLTAGELENTGTYWAEREKGAMNAYTRMAQIAGFSTPNPATTPADIECRADGGFLSAWSVSQASFTTTSNTVHSWLDFKLQLSGTSAIDLVFLRTKDLIPSPAAMVNLQNLWLTPDASVSTVTADQTTCNSTCPAPGNSPWYGATCALGATLTQQSYSKEDLIQVVTNIIERFSPATVGILDNTDIYASAYGWNENTNYVPNYNLDNASHVFSARFSFAALLRTPLMPRVQIYRGYDMNLERENLSGAERDEKRSIGNFYNIADQRNCQSPSDCAKLNFQFVTWFPSRKYVIQEVRKATSLVGPLAVDTGSGQVSCIRRLSTGALTVEACESGGVVPADRIWKLEPSGLLSNSGNYLSVASNGSLTTIALPPSPFVNSRWKLFDNGQLRGTEAGSCIAFVSPVSLALQTCVATSAQRWTLQFGSWGPWSNGSDFSDTAIPLSGTDIYTRSFSMIDANADGKADVCIRRAGGLWCGMSSGTGFGAWSLKGPTGLSDAPDFGTISTGTTIQFGYPSGLLMGPKACGRRTSGVVCGSLAGGSVTPWTSEYSDVLGWGGNETNYGSLRLADVNGDGAADLCGRGSDGIRCTLSTGTGFETFSTVWAPNDFTNALGWSASEYGTSIVFGDINGDGAADVCGRGANGVLCGISSPATRAFGQLHLWSYATPVTIPPSSVTYVPEFSDMSGWNSSAAYYRSFRLSDVNFDGRADLCARSASGLVCAYSNGTSFSAARPLLNRTFTDAQGWNVDRYGSSISFGDVKNDGSLAVCARGGAVYCAHLGNH